MLVAVIVLAATAGPGVRHAQAQVPDLKDPTNAALVYYRVWDTTAHELQWSAAGGASEEVEAMLKSVADDAWTPSAKDAETLRGMQGYVGGMMRAARIPRADWGIQYGDGIFALMPHLVNLRRAQRILDADARRCLAAGGVPGGGDAAERWAACFGMASHVVNDHTMISSLVAAAMAKRTATQVSLALDRKALDPAAVAIVLEGVRRVHGADGLGERQGLLGEAWFAKVGNSTRYTGPDAARRFADEAAAVIAPSDAPPSRVDLDALRRLSERELHAQFELAARYSLDVLAAWHAPDADVRLAELDARLEKGEYGQPARLIAPSVRKYRSSMLEAAAAVDTLARRLEHAAR